MSDKTHEELVQREIDGESTAEESTALGRLTAERPDLRARQEALVRLMADLRRVGLVEPPSTLAGDVMRAVRASARRASPGWAVGLRDALTRRPALGYTWSLAAGLVMGALAVSLAGPRLRSGMDDSAAGALLPSGRLSAARAVDEQEFLAAGIHAMASTRTAEGRVIAEVRIDDAGGPVDVIVEFDPGAFSAVGFERGVASRDEAVVGSGRVYLGHAGPGRYVLVLEPRGTGRPPLRVSLSSKTLPSEGGGTGRFVRLEEELRTR